MATIEAKTPQELANEYNVHVNTVYNYIKGIKSLLNHRKGQKKLTIKQVQIFYGYYGEPN